LEPLNVGSAEGLNVFLAEGSLVGRKLLGKEVGFLEGIFEEIYEGRQVGIEVGIKVLEEDGSKLPTEDGRTEKKEVGSNDSDALGSYDGNILGLEDGSDDGNVLKAKLIMLKIMKILISNIFLNLWKIIQFLIIYIGEIFFESYN